MSAEGSKKTLWEFKWIILAFIVLIGASVSIAVHDEKHDDLLAESLYTYRVTGIVTDPDSKVIEDMSVGGSSSLMVEYRDKNTLTCSKSNNVLVTSGDSIVVTYDNTFILTMDAYTMADKESKSSGTEKISTIFGDVVCNKYTTDLTKTYGTIVTMYSDAESKTVYRFDYDVNFYTDTDGTGKEIKLKMMMDLSERDIQIGKYQESSQVGKVIKKMESDVSIEYENGEISIIQYCKGETSVVYVGTSCLVDDSSVRVTCYDVVTKILTGEGQVVHKFYAVLDDGTILDAKKTGVSVGNSVCWMNNISNEAFSDVYLKDNVMSIFCLDEKTNALTDFAYVHMQNGYKTSDGSFDPMIHYILMIATSEDIM